MATSGYSAWTSTACPSTPTPRRSPGRAGTDGGLLYSPDGTELVLGTTGGFEVVSNTGQPVRYLPMSPRAGTCQPARWWAAGVLLASCTPRDSGIPLLWLVPVDGGPPAQLTVTPGQRSGDYGDVNAWALPGGDYVQDLGACGYIYLAKAGRGQEDQPGQSAGHSGRQVRVRSRRLQRPAGPHRHLFVLAGSASLMWFDPAAGAVTPLLGPPVNAGSVATTLLWGSTPYTSEF